MFHAWERWKTRVDVAGFNLYIHLSISQGMKFYRYAEKPYSREPSGKKFFRRTKIN